MEWESGIDAELLEQGLQWRFESEVLSRCEVVHEGDIGDVLVAELVDVKVARQVSSQSPVHILHRALLPAGVSVAEESGHVHVQRLSDEGVAGELGTIVEGNGAPQPGIELTEHLHDDPSGTFCVLGLEAGADDEAAFALHKHQ